MSDVINKLIDEIGNNINITNFSIISICGAADLGKSYISSQLCKLLNENNIKANHLTMDSFLIDREIRNDLGYSGYNIESYDINGLRILIDRFKSGKEINFKPYNHSIGKIEKESIYMKPSKVLILDGLHSMCEMIRKKTIYSIFLYTDETRLVEMRSEADIEKRKYTKEYSREISQIELRRYKDNVEPYRNYANVKLFLHNRWNYEIEY